jgi:HEAT repeat protein
VDQRFVGSTSDSDGPRGLGVADTAGERSGEGSNPERDAARGQRQVRDATCGSTLAATIAGAQKSAVAPMWIGYAVKAVAGQRTICCGNYSDRNDMRCGKCELESDRDRWSGSKERGSSDKGTVRLEGGQNLIVLFRLQDKSITRIQLASADCELDAGGLPFVWLADVKTQESVAYLATLVRNEIAGANSQDNRKHHSLDNEALTAIALHDGPDAEAALESFVAPSQPEELRKQASFWFGAARGKEGLAALQRLAKSDSSSEVRAQVTFALSVSPEPAALDEMIRMAHEDSSGHVRGQAIFWLAQKAGKRAVGAIDGAIENDPDTEVKKQAVFALSQLPKDQGVPKLIQVAQTNRNPAVRKQAMFWLGQSEDARALDFFEKVLTK